jgi:hypothetical protein
MSRPRSGRRLATCRTGAVAIEAEITLAVVMLIAWAAYKIGVVACANLYHVLSSMVGSFY